MTPKALAASGARTTRTLLGNAPAVVGVAGSTLTLEWGLRVAAAAALPRSEVEVLVGLAIEAEDVLEALECVCWWPCDAAWGIDRMLDTELLVDLRPRSPALDRR
jgi:hypothetical protein